MAIRTVVIDCLLDYAQRAEWNKQNYPLVASECATVSGVVLGEGVTIRTYKMTEDGRATTQNWGASLADACFYVKSDMVRHVGKTVETFTRVERIMSDVWDDIRYIVSYDETSMTFVTEQAPYRGSWAVDATDEVKAIYEAYKAGKAAGESFLNSERAQERRVEEALEEKRRIIKGRTVRVVKGRKVAVGTQGEVFWMKDDRWGMRLGIATTDRTDSRGHWMDVAWVAADNCRTIDNQGNVI